MDYYPDVPEYLGPNGWYDTYLFKKKPDVYWRIAKPTAGIEVERAKSGIYQNEIPPNLVTTLEIRNWEVAALFAGTNMMTMRGNPVLPEKPTREEVEALVDELPPEMVDEIWIEIGRLHRRWGPLTSENWNDPSEDLWPHK